MKRQRAFLTETNPAPFKAKKTVLLASSRGIPLNQTQKLQVKRAIKSKEELKYFDTNFNVVSVPYTGGLQILTLIGQGDGVGARDGDAIKLEKIDFRYNLQAADNTNVMRLILFQYKENTAVAVPTISSILATGASGSVDGFSQYVNYRKGRGFKILKDVTYDMTLNQENTQIPGHWQMPINSLKEISFSAAGTTGYNHLGLAYISDSAAVTHPSLFGQFRVWYTDS